MKVESKAVVLAFLLTCGVVLVQANVAEPEYDDYWKSRAEQAQKYAIQAYTHNPEEVTDQLNTNVEE